VAMESTGVYWIPLFQILETRRLEVRLVNARLVKTVPGRKSDVLDCQWLQKLHSDGLWSGSFRPENQVCVLQSPTGMASLTRASFRGAKSLRDGTLRER
jgi:transposase